MDKNLTSIPNDYTLTVFALRNGTKVAVDTVKSIPEFHTTMISKLLLLEAKDEISLEFESGNFPNLTQYSGGYSLYFAQSFRDFVGKMIFFDVLGLPSVPTHFYYFLFFYSELMFSLVYIIV